MSQGATVKVQRVLESPGGKATGFMETTASKLSMKGSLQVECVCGKPVQPKGEHKAGLLAERSGGKSGKE